MLPTPEPEPELGSGPAPNPAREFRCQDTPTGCVGFGALVIDKSATENQESILFQYQNEALGWDLSRMKGQLEAISAVARDLVGQDATVADLRVKTSQFGENLVKAAFRPIKSGGFEAVMVFIYQINVVRNVVARASLDVLNSMQVLGEEEAHGMMPSDVVPRPLSVRDADLFDKIAKDNVGSNKSKLDLGSDAQLQKHAASALDDLYRTPLQAADEEGRTKTRLVLEGHEPVAKGAEEPPTKPNNPYELARGLHWSNSQVAPDSHHGEVNTDGADDIRGHRRRAMRLPPDAVLLGMIDCAKDAIAFELGAFESVLSKRAKHVHTNGWVRPTAGDNQAWADDWKEGGSGQCVMRVLDELSVQYFHELPRAMPPCGPCFLPEATVYFASPDEARATVSAELTRLETASREQARQIALDARLTYPTRSCLFHKGLLIETHCSPGLTRAIAGYCRREGWLTRKSTDAERIRNPADAHVKPVFIEESAGKFVKLDLAIVAIQLEVICLIVARRDEDQPVTGELEPFYLNAMREAISKLTQRAGAIVQIDKAISGKAPLTLVDGRNNDGVYMDRKLREGEVPRQPDTSVPTLTAGAQNVLLFMVNFDKWSGCVVMRPGPEQYPPGSWKDELRSEFYTACATIRGTLHSLQGMAARVHAAAERNKKTKKTASVTAWPLNHFKLAEDPVGNDFPAKKGPGDSPTAGSKGFAYHSKTEKILSGSTEFGMKITLSGAGCKRWSDDGRQLARLDPGANSVSTFPPEQGNRVFRDKYPDLAANMREQPQGPVAKSYPNARPGLDDAWPLSFWVVGHLLPSESALVAEREFYVCYQDDIPQNVAELAYKVNFACW